MPAQTGKSGLLAKLGNRLTQAAEAHKNDEIVYGQMELPGGIEGGVAKLVDCKFVQIKPGKQNAGEYMFYAAGIVVAPAVHDGIPILGLRTSITEPLFDTPTRKRATINDHVAWIQNAMKLLGASPESLGGTDLETTAAALVKAGVHFRFRTWKGQKETTGPYAGKEPRVNHDWNGHCNYVSEGGAVTAVEDHSDPNADGAMAQEETQVSQETEAVDVGDNGDGGGTLQLPDEAALTALAEKADTKSRSTERSEAQARLTELASTAGVSDNDVSNAKSWADVVAMIMATGGSNGAEESPATEEEFKPSKGDVFAYTPVDDRTKKPLIDARTKKAIKPQQCEVTAVDAKSNTCSLKNLATNVIYKGVDWDALESAQ